MPRSRPSPTPRSRPAPPARYRPSVVFAGLTVVIGLAGLSVVGIPTLTRMGLAAAATVAISVLVALTLLPALLGFWPDAVLPRRVRRGMKAARGDRHADHFNGKVQGEAKGRANGKATGKVTGNGGARWARGVLRLPIPCRRHRGVLGGALQRPDRSEDHGSGARDPGRASRAHLAGLVVIAYQSGLVSRRDK